AGPPAHHAGLHGHRRLVDEPHRSAVRGPQALYPDGHGRSQPRRAPAAHLPLPALPPPPARPDGSSAHPLALLSPHHVGGALADERLAGQALSTSSAWIEPCMTSVAHEHRPYATRPRCSARSGTWTVRYSPACVARSRADPRQWRRCGSSCSPWLQPAPPSSSIAPWGRRACSTPIRSLLSATHRPGRPSPTRRAPCTIFLATMPPRTASMPAASTCGTRALASESPSGPRAGRHSFL